MADNKSKKSFALMPYDIIAIQAIRSAAMQVVGKAMRAIVEREWESAQKLNLAESWKTIAEFLAAYALLARELKADKAAEEFDKMMARADRRAHEIEAGTFNDGVGDTKNDAG